jgi:hypothetical protein
MKVLVITSSRVAEGGVDECRWYLRSGSLVAW